jgi:hypothetical protein
MSHTRAVYADFAVLREMYTCIQDLTPGTMTITTIRFLTIIIL